MSHVDPPPILGALGFLVGRFRGEGTFERGATTFEKDVVGRWEVAGHFLSISMSASYRSNDRVMDVHHAMALVGVERRSGAFQAYVFTDGGEILEHRLVVEADRVSFDDRVPHESRARVARKILVRTAYGYDETLEIDREGGGFETYSFVRLERIAE
ncbi:MAG TPA: hypothetical protein VLF14_07115 [Candidatus Binatia bacterium]|nr:hypothetical protein [Candidatus Binatia bacterium]